MPGLCNHSRHVSRSQDWLGPVLFEPSSPLGTWQIAEQGAANSLVADPWAVHPQSSAARCAVPAVRSWYPEHALNRSINIHQRVQLNSSRHSSWNMRTLRIPSAPLARCEWAKAAGPKSAPQDVVIVSRRMMAGVHFVGLQVIRPAKRGNPQEKDCIKTALYTLFPPCLRA